MRLGRAAAAALLSLACARAPETATRIEPTACDARVRVASERPLLLDVDVACSGQEIAAFRAAEAASVQHLSRLPVVAYWQDHFIETGAFRCDRAVSIDPAMERKVSAIQEHRSQFCEWIPYNAGSHSAFSDFPIDERSQRERLSRIFESAAADVANAYRSHLPITTRYAEAFQISDYGAVPESDELRSYFP